MSIFNKTLLAISLAFAIPLSTQANWFGDLTNSILGKKKTIAAGVVLGGALSYFALKLVNRLHHDIPSVPRDTTLYDTFPDAGKSFMKDLIGGVNRNGGRYPRAKKVNQKIAIVGALCIASGLIYKAHQRNLFGEK